MKKILYISVVIILILCLCSCSKSVKDVSENTTPIASVTEAETTMKAENTTEITTETTTEQDISTAKQNITTTKSRTMVKETTTKKVTTTQKQTNSRKETTTENGCASGNHSMSVGNMGRWFNSRSELQSYWQQICVNLGEKWENGEISDEQYYAQSPYGYEAWSCSWCGKWTGNFKYR
ncbi:MAG: hypothetical protein LUG21_05045 [Clostridiales bacterium]|nr:hypothetical protein [Clostridiales bacterium]